MFEVSPTVLSFRILQFCRGNRVVAVVVVVSAFWEYGTIVSGFRVVLAPSPFNAVGVSGNRHRTHTLHRRTGRSERDDMISSFEGKGKITPKLDTSGTRSSPRVCLTTSLMKQLGCVRVFELFRLCVATPFNKELDSHETTHTFASTCRCPDVHILRGLKNFRQFRFILTGFPLVCLS